MPTMRGRAGKWRRCAPVLGSVPALVAALLVSNPAGADIASDRAAAIVVFPKIVVDTANNVDTLVRLTNTSKDEQVALCYYVDTTPICVGGQAEETCFPDPSNCSGLCQPQWQETDFRVVLTALQPTAWLASAGERDCPVAGGDFGVCSDDPSKTCTNDSDCTGRCVIQPCFPLDGFFREGPRGQSNFGSNIPPVPEDPFVGELKCIAVDSTDNPIDHNSLKGEVQVGFTRGDVGNRDADVLGYNGIGIPALAGTNNRDNTLVLGGPNAEYEGCPNILILDHFFDGAVDPLASNVCRQGRCTITGSAHPCSSDADCVNSCDAGNCSQSADTCGANADCEGWVRIATDVTLIPCTQDFRTQNPELSQTVAQILVFNEFEQRFSTSRTITCFKEIRLSNLDTAQNDRSIFSVGVAGTLTGQTRIRGVDVGADDHGNTLIGVAEEFRCRGTGFPLCGMDATGRVISSSAANFHFQGTRPGSDYLYLP